MGFANMHLWTGSYDSSVRSWDYVDLLERIRERRNMKKMELYSFKAEAYQTVIDTKRKKRKKGKKGKRSGKSASKGPGASKGKSKSPTKGKSKGKSKSKSPTKKGG